MTFIGLLRNGTRFNVGFVFQERMTDILLLYNQSRTLFECLRVFPDDHDPIISEARLRPLVCVDLGLAVRSTSHAPP